MPRHLKVHVRRIVYLHELFVKVGMSGYHIDFLMQTIRTSCPYDGAVEHVLIKQKDLYDMLQSCGLSEYIRSLKLSIAPDLLIDIAGVQ